MAPLEILIKARALISEPNRWARDALAFDRRGNEVDPTDKTAFKWCAAGAIIRALEGRDNIIVPQCGDIDAAQRYLRNAIKDRCVMPLAIHEFNDCTNHGNVIAAFDAAIEEARKQQ